MTTKTLNLTENDLIPKQESISFKAHGVLCAAGRFKNFKPGGLSSPAWSLIVNARGYYDKYEQFNEDDLNEAFEPGNQDGGLQLLDNNYFEMLKQHFWKYGLTHAAENKQCQSGSAYCIWNMINNQTVVGYFDNGGSDIASSAIYPFTHNKKIVLLDVGSSHFDIENFEVGTLERDLLNNILALSN